MERAEAQNRLNSIKERLLVVARVQEGDEPDENPTELLRELNLVSARIDELVTAINETNSSTAFDSTRNLTAALAEREGLLRMRRLYGDIAKAAGERRDRYSHGEIRYVATLPVAELRAKADEISKQYRELDTKIQHLNWSTELVS